MKTNLSARNLSVLSRQEQRDLLEEEHQENLERVKEQNDLASFHDLLDEEMERDNYNSYMDSLDDDDMGYYYLGIGNYYDE
jgi:hypothetical protein